MKKGKQTKNKKHKLRQQPHTLHMASLETLTLRVLALGNCVIEGEDDCESLAESACDSDSSCR